MFGTNLEKMFPLYDMSIEETFLHDFFKNYEANAPELRERHSIRYPDNRV